MKIMVLGAYGMLGHKLIQMLSPQFETYATCRKIRTIDTLPGSLSSNHLISNVNAEDITSVLHAITEVKPDVVINCIGVIKQLEASKDQNQSITINALFPHKLATICRATGIRLIHFSTDCVFSGKKGMYSNQDIPDAEDIYGITKYLGEIEGEGCLTIRSSIIGWELGTQNGLIEWFLDQAGGDVNGYRKAIYSGFTTIEMSRIIEMILNDHPNISGVWHVASSPISKYDLLQLINEKMGLNIKIKPDDKFMCDRRLDGYLFAERTGYIAPDWDIMIEELVKDFLYYNDLRKMDVKI